MDILAFLRTPGGITLVTGIVGAFFYAFGAAINGLNKADRQLIATLKETITELQKRDKEQQLEIDDQSKEIKRLLSERQEMDGRMQTLVEVLQNRSPELQEHLHDMDKKLLLVLKVLALQLKKNPEIEKSKETNTEIIH